MQDNDSLVVAFFRNDAIQDMAASKKEGRPVYRDMELCEMRIAGDRNFAPVVPAHSMWKRVDGEEVTYAQRFAPQYERFKANNTQIAEGTPLSELPFLTEAKRQELRGLKVYTAEALASLDGKNLHALGLNGREMKNQATAYLERAGGSAVAVELAAEVALLKEQLAALKAEPVATEEMPDLAKMKDEIERLTGSRPRGNPSFETLSRMLTEVQKEQA